MERQNTHTTDTEDHDDALDEAEARQARIEYLRSLRPGPRRRPAWVRTLITIVVVLLVLIGAGVVYWRTVGNGRDTDMASGTTAQQGQAGSQQADKPVPMKRYESTRQGVSFDYPETWKVTEGNSGGITVLSPAMQLTGGNGQQLLGQIVVAINPKGQNLAPFDAGNATAVLDSIKIKYAQPSSVQRGETYVSFVQYAATQAQGALDGIYITGDFGYQKGQAVPQVDVLKLDPVISATFTSCKNETCANATATNVQSSSWDKQPAAKLVRAMFTSLTVH